MTEPNTPNPADSIASEFDAATRSAAMFWKSTAIVAGRILEKHGWPTLILLALAFYARPWGERLLVKHFEFMDGTSEVQRTIKSDLGTIGGKVDDLHHELIRRRAQNIPGGDPRHFGPVGAAAANVGSREETDN